MVSRQNDVQLDHVFILMTNVFSTLGTPEETNGMFQCKAIFANDTINSHNKITDKMWQDAQQTFMFFQPSVIGINRLIKSHVTIGDVRKNDTCWSQTCRIERCIAMVESFTGPNVPHKRKTNGVGGAANANSRGKQVEGEGEEEEEEEDEEEEGGEVEGGEVKAWCTIDLVSDDEVNMPQQPGSSTDPQHFASEGQKRQGSPESLLASSNGGASDENNRGKRLAIDTEPDAARLHEGVPPHSLFLSTKAFTASEAAYGSKSLMLSTSTMFGRVIAFIHSTNDIVRVLCRIFRFSCAFHTRIACVLYSRAHMYTRYPLLNLLVICRVQTHVPAQRHCCVLCC